MTVRDMARRDDPNFDRDLSRQIADGGPKIAAEHARRSTRRCRRSCAGLDDAQQAIERAVANMPDPTYPRR